jgi:hypothetical protein
MGLELIEGGLGLLLEKEPKNMQAQSLGGLIEAAVAKGESRVLLECRDEC